MSAPVRCRPQHDDAPVVTRSLLEESNVAAAIFPERSRRSRSDTSTSRKNIKFGGVWACRSDSSTRVSEASETRDTTRRTGVSLCRPTAGRGDASDKSNSSTVGQVSRSRSDGVRLFDSCYTQALNTTLHARQRPRRVASRLDAPGSGSSMGRCSVTLKAPRRYGPSPLGLRATAFSRALTDWASTRWPVWVVRRCRKPTLRMAPFLRSASSSSSNATSTGDKQRQQELQQEKRCAACWLPLVQGVLRQDM